MNVEPSKSAGNVSIASSSFSPSPKQYLPNGGCQDRSYNSLSNDVSFPPGGVPSLKLPVVVTKLYFTCISTDIYSIHPSFMHSISTRYMYYGIVFFGIMCG